MQLDLKPSTLISFFLILGCTTVDGATTHTPAFVLRAAVVVAVFIYWPKNNPVFRLGQILTPCLALLAIGLGNLLAQNIGLAIQPTVTTIACIGLFLALIHREEDALQSLIHILIAVGVVHSVWAVWQIFGDAPRSSGGFFNPNNLAAFLVPLCLVSLKITLDQGKRSLSKWHVITLILVMGIVVTYSRSGIVTLAAAVSVYLIGRFRFKALIPIGLLGIGLLGVILWRHTNLAQFDPYNFSRIDIWRESILLALENPFGVGLGGFGIAMQQQGVALEGLVRYPKIAHKAHSELFQVWVELGWPGFIALASGPITILSALNRQRRQGKAIAFDLGMLLAFTLPALAFTTMHVPIIAITATLWAASVVGSTPEFGPPVPFSTGTGRTPAVAIVCFFALLLAIPGALAEHFQNRTIHFRSENNLTEALRTATLSSQFAPWSVAKNILKESIIYKIEKNALESSKRLALLADRFPNDPLPVRRAILLLPAINNLPLSQKVSIKKSLLDQLVKRSPTDAFPHFELAQLYRDTSNNNLALESIRGCLTIEPNFALCLALRAEILYQSGQLQLASQSAQLAIEANKASVNQLNGRARNILHLPPEKMRLSQEIVSELR